MIKHPCAYRGYCREPMLGDGKVGAQLCRVDKILDQGRSEGDCMSWLCELTPFEGEALLFVLDEHLKTVHGKYEPNCMLCQARSRISLGRDYHRVAPVEVKVDSEDVWLTFKTSDGKSATLSATAIANGLRGPVTEAALRQWIDDRKRDAV